jgi:hypothetical protein
MATPWGRSKNPFDNAIQIRVRRFNQTFFVLCDKHEMVSVLKTRILSIFE